MVTRAYTRACVSSAQFKMVDRDDTGMITFAEFALFTHIMSNPDPEFEIAFRYFDRLTNGYACYSLCIKRGERR